MKDEEIRNLSQLAAAHKEQIAILYSQMVCDRRADCM